MNFEAFALTIENQIAHVAFNSLNPAFWNELPKVFDEIEARDD